MSNQMTLAEISAAAKLLEGQDRQWATAWGKDDGEKGENFFPEQMGKWAQLYYAEGFNMAQPNNDSCQLFLRQAYRRLQAEEAEMMWRETVLHSGGRFAGASLIPAEMSA